MMIREYNLTIDNNNQKLFNKLLNNFWLLLFFVQL